MVGTTQRAPGGDHAFGFNRVLDGHRHPMQRPDGSTAMQLLIQLARSCQGGFGEDDNDRVERRVHCVNPVKVRLEDLDG